MSNKTPLACDLSAIKDDELQDHKINSEAVFTSIKDVQELPDGYSFHIPTKTELIKQAGAFMSLERKCCPFFHFSLEVTADHGPALLKITGDNRVKEFVKQNIVAQIASDSKDWEKPENG